MELPDQGGTYILIASLDRLKSIEIARLGRYQVSQPHLFGGEFVLLIQTLLIFGQEQAAAYRSAAATLGGRTNQYGSTRRLKPCIRTTPRKSRLRGINPGQKCRTGPRAAGELF